MQICLRENHQFRLLKESAKDTAKQFPKIVRMCKQLIMQHFVTGKEIEVLFHFKDLSQKLWSYYFYRKRITQI